MDTTKGFKPFAQLRGETVIDEVDSPKNLLAKNVQSSTPQPDGAKFIAMGENAKSPQRNRPLAALAVNIDYLRFLLGQMVAVPKQLQLESDGTVYIELSDPALFDASFDRRGMYLGGSGVKETDVAKYFNVTDLEGEDILVNGVKVTVTDVTNDLGGVSLYANPMEMRAITGTLPLGETSKRWCVHCPLQDLDFGTLGVEAGCVARITGSTGGVNDGDWIIHEVGTWVDNEWVVGAGNWLVLLSASPQGIAEGAFVPVSLRTDVVNLGAIQVFDRATSVLVGRSSVPTKPVVVLSAAPTFGDQFILHFGVMYPRKDMPEDALLALTMGIAEEVTAPIEAEFKRIKGLKISADWKLPTLNADGVPQHNDVNLRDVIQLSKDLYTAPDLDHDGEAQYDAGDPDYAHPLETRIEALRDIHRGFRWQRTPAPGCVLGNSRDTVLWNLTPTWVPQGDDVFRWSLHDILSDAVPPERYFYTKTLETEAHHGLYTFSSVFDTSMAVPGRAIQVNGNNAEGDYVVFAFLRMVPVSEKLEPRVALSYMALGSFDERTHGLEIGEFHLVGDGTAPDGWLPRNLNDARGFLSGSSVRGTQYADGGYPSMPAIFAEADNLDLLKDSPEQRPITLEEFKAQLRQIRVGADLEFTFLPRLRRFWAQGSTGGATIVEDSTDARVLELAREAFGSGELTPAELLTLVRLFGPAGAAVLTAEDKGICVRLGDTNDLELWVHRERTDTTGTGLGGPQIGFVGLDSGSGENDAYNGFVIKAWSAGGDVLTAVVQDYIGATKIVELVGHPDWTDVDPTWRIMIYDDATKPTLVDVRKAGATPTLGGQTPISLNLATGLCTILGLAVVDLSAEELATFLSGIDVTGDCTADSVTARVGLLSPEFAYGDEDGVPTTVMARGTADLPAVAHTAATGEVDSTALTRLFAGNIVVATGKDVLLYCPVHLVHSVAGILLTSIQVELAFLGNVTASLTLREYGLLTKENVIVDEPLIDGTNIIIVDPNRAGDGMHYEVIIKADTTAAGSLIIESQVRVNYMVYNAE